MRASTRIMLKKHGWRLDRFIHNYLYFLFYYPYVRFIYTLLPALNHLARFRPIVPIGRMVFDRYHSKVLSAGDTKKVFALNRDIRIVAEENKRVIPYKYATKIIFQEPEFIAVMDCPCKKSAGAAPADINSCIAVGRGLASFWLDHCAKYHARKINQAEAMQIIARLRQQGHITQAFFKVATGGSTGVICNCHPDTCASLQATLLSRRIDRALSMTAESGYSVVCDAAKCRQCGRCADACHFGAVAFKGGERRYDPGLCLGCELCVETCPESALALYTDPSKPLPLDLDTIKPPPEKLEKNAARI